MLDMRGRVARGSIWMTAGKAVQLACQIGSLLVLARYLDKSEFGLASMTALVIAVFGAGADLGMSVLGVQREQPDEEKQGADYCYDDHPGRPVLPCENQSIRPSWRNTVTWRPSGGSDKSLHYLLRRLLRFVRLHKCTAL